MCEGLIGRVPDGGIGLRALLGAFSLEDEDDGAPEDPEVGEEVPFVDVAAVEADDFFEVGDLGAAADLP